MAGYTEKVRILVDGRAELNLSDSDGRTALELACRKSHREAALLERFDAVNSAFFSESGQTLEGFLVSCIEADFCNQILTQFH